MDLADGTFAGPEWEGWLAAHPELAAEVAAARQVRALLGELRSVPIALPADFEAVLMARVGRDATFLGLLTCGSPASDARSSTCSTPSSVLHPHLLTPSQ